MYSCLIDLISDDNLKLFQHYILFQHKMYTVCFLVYPYKTTTLKISPTTHLNNGTFRNRILFISFGDEGEFYNYSQLYLLFNFIKLESQFNTCIFPGLCFCLGVDSFQKVPIKENK